MALLKFLFLLTTLLMAATVTATRDVNQDSQGLERMLVQPSANMMTCLRGCTANEDCSDGWVCKLCIFMTERTRACSAF
ncbi:hypothetical protein RND71_021212 [Anisodus tanguticus]|uniref:Carboxypeptidase A inhibitor-like domain-containing protein n=1 Tax=Anisodus tanguticus TaxID=243964 RepID=A0AAE1RWS7_9SOLA|nr:hypothetical protein RND71_021206 [Anisodus tanguticus]KAK4358983.1 hypothetical protein RND71_021212 [Anisodus tanguticus]